MKIISTENAPMAIGPYCQATVSNGFVFTSGQIPINPASNTVEAQTIEEQARQVMLNLKAVLSASGTSFDRVVKTTCFLSDMELFSKFNDVYAEFFVNKPARSCVAVKELPKNVLCEVEVIAEI